MPRSNSAVFTPSLLPATPVTRHSLASFAAMYARLKNLRCSPRKARYVADLVRGMSVHRALAMLAQVRKRASRPIAELIRSAVANAIQKDENVDPSTLYVRTILVDKGITFKRFVPRARGSATPILKKSSHIALWLGEDLS